MLVNKHAVVVPLERWMFTTGLHVELALLGWILQLVMGTAYWILPRYHEEPKRGSPVLAWGSYTLFNGGLLVMAGVHLYVLPAFGALAGRVLLLVGVLCFVLLIWPRVFAFMRKD